MIRSILSAAATCVLLATTPGAGQTVDYTNAEKMFGEPVTVSVTGKPQRASEAPANITILTADQIRRSGAVDIPAALRFVAGLDVRRYGAFGAAVGIRGYNTAMNPRVLVLLDGRQVYQDDYGYTSWSLIPVTIDEIRQIEIIRGPSAALYGFNAVSGVINIVTYDPLRDDRTSFSAVGGTNDFVYGEGTATLRPSENVGLRFSGKAGRSDEIGSTATFNSIEQPELRSGSADLRARLADEVQLDVSASIGRLDSDLFVDVGAYAPTQLENAHLRSRFTVGTRWGFAELDAYHNALQTESDIFGLLLGWDQAVSVVKASNLARLGSDHTIRVGAEYRHNVISSPIYYGGDMTSDLIAASGGWNWDITPELSFTNAGRIDSISFSRNGADVFVPGLGSPLGDRSMTEASYNSTLLYRPTDYDRFRLGTGRALQLPSLFSLGFGGELGLARVYGSRDLDPSSVTNYEIGYERLLPALSSTFEVSVFHQITDRTIGSPFGSGLTILPSGIPLLAARNFDGSRATGGEIGIDGAAAGWRWNLSYSLAEVRDETPLGLLAVAPSVSYEAQTPTHAVIAGAGYSHGPLELDIMARWQSRFTDFRIVDQIEQVEISDYITMTARVGYRLSEIATLSLTGEQINAERQIQTAGRQTERRILGGLKLEF